MPSTSSLMTTGRLRTTPVVISLWACAAIGTPKAPAIAAMASTLFRMFNSFAMMHAGRSAARNPIQSIARGIVPGTMMSCPLQFSAFLPCRNPIGTTSVCYRGTAPQDKMRISIRFRSHFVRRDFYDHYCCPHPRHRGLDCRHPDFDHAAAVESGGRDLSDLHRPDRPGRAQMASHVASKPAFSPCAEPPKVV